MLDIEIALIGIIAKTACMLQFQTGPDEATTVIFDRSRLGAIEIHVLKHAQ